MVIAKLVLFFFKIQEPEQVGIAGNDDGRSVPGQKGELLRSPCAQAEQRRDVCGERTARVRNLQLPVQNGIIQLETAAQQLPEEGELMGKFHKSSHLIL